MTVFADFFEGIYYANRDVPGKKNGRAGCSLGPPDIRLEASHVRCLQTLGALGDLELNRLTFVQRLVSIRHDCREMDKDVFAGLALNEAKTLASIEPLYCSLFFHLCFLFFYKKLFGASRLPPAVN